MTFEHLVIVLPGISGSVLAKDGKEIWGSSADAIWRAVTTGGDSIRQLRLPGPDDPNVDDLGDGVTATCLAPDLHIIPGLWKIDGYSGLVRWLQEKLGLEPEKNLLTFPYDWRRDNRVSARRLERFANEKLSAWRKASGNRDARIVFVVHSMGGLVARWFLEVLGGWRIARALVSFGTPYRGSLNALGYLANGYAQSVGPLSLDLTDTLKSFSSVYQLLPAFECVDRGGGRLERVGEIAGLPGVDDVRAADALEFYRKMRQAQEANAKAQDYVDGKYEIFPIVGVAQPTFQSAIVSEHGVTLSRTIGGKDESGDGTVPRVSAVPLELDHAHRETFVAETHGSLQNFDAALVQLVSALTGLDIDLGHYRFAANTVSLDIDDVYPAEEVTIRATPSIDVPVVARIVPASAAGGTALDLPLTPQQDGVYVGRTRLGPGAYRVAVVADFHSGPARANDLFLVHAA